MRSDCRVEWSLPVCRLVQEGKAAKEALAEKGVAEFSPYDAESWRARFQELGETLPPDVKAWFKVSKVSKTTCLYSQNTGTSLLTTSLCMSQPRRSLPAPAAKD